MPSEWLSYFAYEKKGSGDALGLSSDVMVGPALSVVPMGWTSAVAVIQAAARRLVLVRAEVVLSTEVATSSALPAGTEKPIIYIVSFDELITVQSNCRDVLEDKSSPAYDRCAMVCDDLSLPRNVGKQLVGALHGSLQGAELDGAAGWLGLEPKRIADLVWLSIRLLAQDR